MRSKLAKIISSTFDPKRYDLSELVPHKPPLLLIHEVLAVTEQSISVLIDLSIPSVFHEDDGLVASYVGIEYISQAAAALVGYHRVRQGLDVKIGFLLGTRLYNSVSNQFDFDEKLIVQVTEEWVDDIIGVYQGQIMQGDNLFASSQIKAIMPEDHKRLFKR